MADEGSRRPPTPVAPFLGSERLGGRLPDAEKKRLDKLLRDHGFHEARRRAVLFGRRLARSLAGAEDLAQRACLRLVRLGWDPNEVALEKRLCRLVWSEWTNEKSEDARRRKGEAGFLAEMAAHEGTSSRSTEDYRERLDEERAEEQHAVSQVERLRQALIAEKDDVNLYWLQCTLEGKTDLAQMARESARDVKEFYAAAKRRNRIVARLVAEDRGVTHDPEEKPQ